MLNKFIDFCKQKNKTVDLLKIKNIEINNNIKIKEQYNNYNFVDKKISIPKLQHSILKSKYEVPKLFNFVPKLKGISAQLVKVCKNIDY